MNSHTRFIYLDKIDLIDNNKNNYIVTNTNNILVNDIILFIKNQYKRLDFLYHVDDNLDNMHFPPNYKEDMKYCKILVDIFSRIFHLLHLNRYIIVNFYSSHSNSILFKTFQFEPNSHLDLTFEIKMITLKNWLSNLYKIYKSYYIQQENDIKIFPKFLKKINKAYDIGYELVEFLEIHTSNPSYNNIN